MIPALKSEYLKLVTARSTYISIALCMAFVVFGTFFIDGYKSGTPLDAYKLSNAVTNSATVVALFAAVVPLILFAYEYRHNTITYSLTATNSRSKVLAAKIVVAVGFAAVFSLVCMGLAIGGVTLGVLLKGASLPPQTINIAELMLKCVTFSASFALVGVLLVLLLRNLVACIILFFILPSTIEPLLSILLKDNAKYLPFMSVSHLIQASNDGLSPLKGFGVFMIYMIVGYGVGWWLFLKRDAI